MDFNKTLFLLQRQNTQISFFQPGMAVFQGPLSPSLHTPRYREHSVSHSWTIPQPEFKSTFSNMAAESAQYSPAPDSPVGVLSMVEMGSLFRMALYVPLCSEDGA